MNAKTTEFSRTAAKTMLDAQIKMIDATLQQQKIMEDQTAALFAATRRNAELHKDLVNSLGKVWLDAFVPAETKAETK